MQYFVSKNHNRLNGKPFQPELVNPRICLNPKYPASVIKAAKPEILLDSGAFQDRQREQRLTFSGALQRQLDFEERHDLRADMLVSYDRLVDESPGSPGRSKRRVYHALAEKYVKETIEAAEFLVDQRRDLKPRRLVLSCQGTTAPQYLRCVDEILEMTEPGDVIGFGGFCIVGQHKRLAKQFFSVLEAAVPKLKKHGITAVHFFGVGYFPVLVRAHVLCRAAGIEPSYDTSSYEFNGVLGRVFNPLARATPMVFPPPDKKVLYHPADLALLNVRLVTNFWKELNSLYPAKGVT